jgi:2-desacetyl-2-hydroxyethyl bacteriochlorophyllide A dehydrogenase
MKAVVLYAPGNVAVGDLPLKDLAPGEVRVKIAYCGICGSDFHKVEGKKNTRKVTYPVALGHEISGIVDGVGDGVTEFKQGDRVTVDPNWGCGKCEFCKYGKRSYCKNSRGVVKGMAEYINAPVENVYALPDRISLRDAALAEPVACCLRGADLLGVRHGERVALVGLGAIGTIMIQLIRSAGAGEIIVIEYDETKENLAYELGADLFICSKDEKRIAEYSENYNVDKVIECVGNTSAQLTALNIAGRGATVVMFGVADSAKTTPISLYDAFIKELTIKTSYINPYTTERAVRLLASGILNTNKIIHRELTMEEAADEFMNPQLSRFGKLLVKID